jgi:hypothetical protein
MSKLSEVHKALACGAARVRAIDTVVGEVLQGRQDMSVCQGENGKGYEVFQHGRWDVSSEFSGLVLFMKNELCELFGQTWTRGDGEEISIPPPEPMQSDGFITKVCECMVKYLPKAAAAPLDFDMWGKLLFNDGMVYDYKSDELRKQYASDRLWRHTPRDVPEWDAQGLKSLITEFSANVREFFVEGGCNFDPIVDQDDERHLKGHSGPASLTTSAHAWCAPWPRSCARIRLTSTRLCSCCGTTRASAPVCRSLWACSPTQAQRTAARASST